MKLQGKCISKNIIHTLFAHTQSFKSVGSFFILFLFNTFIQQRHITSKVTVNTFQINFKFMMFFLGGKISFHKKAPVILFISLSTSILRINGLSTKTAI